MAENQGDRLQKARIKAGFKTAADAARAFGWPAITYRAHESGGRGLKREVAMQYGKAFKVSPANNSAIVPIILPGTINPR